MARRTQFAVSNCNLYNLNMPGLSIYRDADGWSQEAFDLKVDWLRRAVLSMPSEVWGFQELWHKDAIEEVFADPNLADFECLVPDDHKGGKIICGAAVRKRIMHGEPEWIEDFPTEFKMQSGGDDAQSSNIAVQLDRFSRPVLKFKVKPRSNGRLVTVYVVHLKSKLPSKIYYEDWYRDNRDYYKRHTEAIGAGLATVRRTAEAVALRMLLTEEMKGTDTPVVVLGDLNDGHRSNTLNILTGQPNYILSGLDKGGGDIDLYSAASLQAFRSERNVYYTHIHQSVQETLDHILVSQEFYDNSRKRIWAFKGYDILNDHLNDDAHKEDGTTDHGVVRARFEYRPA
ncbi:MAG: endonuclease/exonuclease/phosphatase family protein [Verrucomicrobiota bacterium]